MGLKKTKQKSRHMIKIFAHVKASIGMEDDPHVCQDFPSLSRPSIPILEMIQLKDLKKPWDLHICVECSTPLLAILL